MSDLQFAIAEKSVNDVIQAAITKGAVLPVYSAPKTNIGHGLSYSCDFGLKLTDGKVDFRSGGPNGNVLLKEFDVTWDPLILHFSLDIPTLEIGCECFTIDLGIFSKTICLPCIRLFQSDSDINVPIDLSHIFTHEFSGEFAMRIESFRLNERTSQGLTDFEATLTPDTTNEVRDDIRDRFLARLPSFTPTPWIQNLSQEIVDALGLKTNLADKTRFYFEGDKWLDIDVIDFADTVANILKKITDAIVDKFLSFIPGWARDIISDVLSFIIDGIEAVLDFSDDVEEFINDFFNVSFGLLDLTAELLLSFVSQVPLYQIEKPYKIINPESDKLPLLIPYDNLKAAFTNDEVVIGVDTAIL
jgi:hypothetical protein